MRFVLAAALLAVAPVHAVAAARPVAFAGEAPRQIKVHKPLIEVTEDDVRAALASGGHASARGIG